MPLRRAMISGKLSHQGRKVLKPKLDLEKSETDQKNGERQGTRISKEAKKMDRMYLLIRLSLFMEPLLRIFQVSYLPT